MLYDSSKNQIDKRFMNKDEVVNSGGSLTFDAHLVDIGDPMGTNGDDADVKIQERNSSASGKSEILAGRQRKKSFSDFSVSHAKRSRESTPMDHVGSGNSGVIGKPRDDACSTKRVNSCAGSFGFDKIKQKKIFASHSSLRDANQILSIMRKPVTRDTTSTVEDAPMQQCPPSSSELVQLHDDSQAFDSSLQVDRCQVIKAVEKHNNEKAADGQQNITFSEGNCNNLERPDSTQGIEILRSNTFESPRKSQSTVGSRVDHGRSVVLQSSERSSSVDNLWAVKLQLIISLLQSCQRQTQKAKKKQLPPVQNGLAIWLA